MSRFLFTFALVVGAPLLLLLAVTTGCGANDVSTRTPPVRWAGSAGSALIGEGNLDSDGVTDHLWVGFNDPTKWQQFQSLRSKHGNNGQFWIGGKVVVSADSSVGFYFDPATTEVGEVTAEGAETTLDFIKANPAYFANNDFGNPPLWYVPAFIEQVASK